MLHLKDLADVYGTGDCCKAENKWAQDKAPIWLWSYARFSQTCVSFDSSYSAQVLLKHRYLWWTSVSTWKHQRGWKKTGDPSEPCHFLFTKDQRLPFDTESLWDKDCQQVELHQRVGTRRGKVLEMHRCPQKALSDGWGSIWVSINRCKLLIKKATVVLLYLNYIFFWWGSSVYMMPLHELYHHYFPYYHIVHSEWISLRPDAIFFISVKMTNVISQFYSLISVLFKRLSQHMQLHCQLKLYSALLALTYLEVWHLSLSFMLPPPPSDSLKQSRLISWSPMNEKLPEKLRGLRDCQRKRKRSLQRDWPKKPVKSSDVQGFSGVQRPPSF